MVIDGHEQAALLVLEHVMLGAFADNGPLLVAVGRSGKFIVPLDKFGRAGRMGVHGEEKAAFAILDSLVAVGQFFEDPFLVAVRCFGEFIVPLNELFRPRCLVVHR